MDMTQTTLMFPVESIITMLDTRNLTRTKYMTTRKDIMDWQRQNVGHVYPISLTESEMATMDFVDYQLTPEEKDQCSNWMTDPSTNILESCNRIAHDGYRITVTHDEKNSCICVTMIGKTPTNVNAGLGMSTRHATVEIALAMAVYKQEVIFGGQSWGESDSSLIFG